VIGNLTKKKANRVCGIDASTNSLAWAIFEDGKPVDCGEVFFDGATVFERLKDAKAKTKDLVASGVLKADYIAIEAAVRVNSLQTYADLAYVYGVIIGELMAFNPEVHKVYPIQWQTAIGNPNLKKDEKEQIKHDFPGKSDNWYKNKGREIRKQRTLDIAHSHFPSFGDSNNIGDAVGLALYIGQSLTRTS